MITLYLILDCLHCELNIHYASCHHVILVYLRRQVILKFKREIVAQFFDKKLTMGPSTIIIVVISLITTSSTSIVLISVEFNFDRIWYENTESIHNFLADFFTFQGLSEITKQCYEALSLNRHSAEIAYNSG